MSKRKLEKIAEAEEAAINNGIALDLDNPEWTGEMFAKAKRGRPKLPENIKRQPVTVKLDPDIIEFYRKDGRGFGTRINDALRKAAGLK